jgi:iron complex outermembrane receptor protein
MCSVQNQKCFFDNSNLSVNLGFLYNARKEFEEQIEPSLYMKLKTFNYDIKYELPELGKFETIVGTQGMSQTNANYGEETLVPDATTNDFGLLAVSHVHFEKADLQLGARFDNRVIDIVNDTARKNFNSFNGAVGIKTNLMEKLTARLNLASGFRAPNLAELSSDGVHEGTNRYEIGNINLGNEQNVQTDLALEFKNEHVEVYANAFYNKVNNYIFLSPNGDIIDNNPVYTYLQDDAKLYGGEFGLHLHPHPLDWLHFESSFETVTGKQDNGDYLPLIPANSISNTFRAEFDNDNLTENNQKVYLKNSYVFVKLKSTFKQHHVSDFETNTEGYNLLSAGFGGTLNMFKNQLTLTVSGSNLTNRKYINHLSRFKIDNIYNMGRNISFGMTYTM